jgi:hypothetical protein
MLAPHEAPLDPGGPVQAASVAAPIPVGRPAPSIVSGNCSVF